MAGAIDLFSGSTSLSGTNLWQTDKSPLNQLDQGVQDVIGQHGQNTGNAIFQSLNNVIDLILGIDPNSPAGQNPDWGTVPTMFSNLFTFLGGIDPASPNFDPIGAIINFIITMLKPQNLLAALVPHGSMSGGVTGYIPLENLAIDLIAGLIGGAQGLIDAILSLVGFGPGSGTEGDVNNFFDDLLAMLGRPPLTSDTFTPNNALTTLINDLIHPLNLLAPLENLFPGSHTVPQANLPGIDASKVTSGQFPTNMISGLVTAVESLPQWLVPFVPVSSIGAGNPNLLPNPNYAGSASVVDPTGRWTYDPTVDHTGDGSGSATVTANGVLTSMVSNARIPVGQGQTMNLSHYLKWSGVTGSGECFVLSILAYQGDTVAGQTDIANITNPTTNSDWVQISGSYDVPAGVDNVRVLLSVTSNALTGQIWWDDASLTGTNVLPQELVNGLPGDIANLFSGLDARALVTDFNNLLNNLGLGSFGSVGEGISAIVARFFGMNSAGQFDASQLHNTNNIPKLLSSSVGGIAGIGDIGTALQNTWDHLVGGSSGSGSLLGINTRLSAVSTTGQLDAGSLHNITAIPQLQSSSVAGIGGIGDIGASLQQTWDSIIGGGTGSGSLSGIVNRLFHLNPTGGYDAAALTNTANIPQLQSSSVSGIAGLPDIGTALQHTWDTLANAATGMGNLGGVNTRMSNLSTAGQFDASQLSNVSAMPPLSAGSIPALDSSKIVSGVFDILRVPTGSLGAHNILDLGGLMDSVTNTLLGMTGAFSGTTVGQATGSMNSLYNNVTVNTQSIQALQSSGGATDVSGVAVNVAFSNYPDGPLPGMFTTTYSGSGTSALGIKSGVAGWNPLNNDGNRAAVTVYNVAPTNTDFQIVRGVMSAAPQQGGSGGTPRIWAIGRVDNPNNPQNYVWMRGYCTGFLNYSGDIGCTVGGVDTVFVSGISLTWSMDIQINLGVGGNPRRYQIFSGTQLVYDYTESGTTSQLGSGFRYWGAKTEMKTASGGAKQPGGIASTSVNDSAPPTVLGSTFRITRHNTATATLASGGVTSAPAGFFDTQDWISPDMHWDGNNLTVNTDGTYLVNLRYNATNIPGNAKADAAMVQNGNPVRLMGGDFAAGSVGQPSGDGISGVAMVYLHTGDVLTPGYQVSSNCTVTGDANGISSYFEVALMNRSMA